MIPKDEFEAVNLWFAIKKTRVALEKEIERLKVQEKELCDWIRDQVGWEKPIVGDKVVVTVSPFFKPVVADWHTFMEEVRKQRGLHDHLLYQRVAEDKTRAALDAGILLPGIDTVQETKVSYRSIRR